MLIRHGRKMVVAFRLAGQGLGNAAQVQRGAVALCRCPIDDELDALAHATRRFRPVQPYREQQVAHGWRTDQVNAGVADGGKGVAFKAR